ncbi:MAG: hypothetical protein V7741_12665 [Hyphomonas sp.]
MGEDNKSSSLGQRLLGCALFFAMGIAMTGWAAYGTWLRLEDIASAPDLNGDGRFTLLDIPQAVGSVILAAGDQYQALFAETTIGQFLEMRGDNPRWIWSTILTVAAWGLGLGWISLAWQVLSAEPGLR